MHYTTELAELQERCFKANSFRELAAVALEELAKFPNGAEMVFGPITRGGIIRNGGFDISANIQVMKLTIMKLLQQGRPIFDQTAYEMRMNHLRRVWQEKKPLERRNAYCMEIIDDFYVPLLHSGQVHVGHFIDGWHKSTGAQREHEVLLELGKKVVYLDRNFHLAVSSAA